MRFPSSGIRRRDFLATLLAATAALNAPLALAEPESNRDFDADIGAMIIIGFHGDAPDSPGAMDVADWLRAGLVGGVIFFEDNLRSPDAVIALTKLFTTAAGRRTPFLCVDQEGGEVSRLRPERGFTALPAAADVADGSLEQATALYDKTAAELRRLGFNLNLGPVVDLAANEDSRIIYGLGRSFGADPVKVTNYARAFIEAHRRHHVLTALKHFPGHGSTALDSHRELPDITRTWRREELIPFNKLTNAGFADMVMVGHLVHAGMTEHGRPASLSTRAVTGELRERLGYNEVVVTDDMQMGALRGRYSPDEAIELGLDAGVDLFLYSNHDYPDPQMPRRFHRVVRAAIDAGRLAPERIRASAARLKVLRSSIEFANAELATRLR